VVGSSDKIGGYPASRPADPGSHGRDHLPGRSASPQTAAWKDGQEPPPTSSITAASRSWGCSKHLTKCFWSLSEFFVWLRSPRCVVGSGVDRR